MGNFVKVDEVKSFLNYTDSAYDVRIQNWLEIYPERIITICNNKFGHEDAYVEGDDFEFSASGNTITTSDEDYIDDGRFKSGDNIYIKGTLRNDGHYKISTVTTTVITINTAPGYGQKSLVDEDMDDEDIDNALITLVIWPQAIKPIVANMIRYDMIERIKKTGVSSERVGNYSVSYARSRAIGYDYPDDVVGGLDAWSVPAVG